MTDPVPVRVRYSGEAASQGVGGTLAGEHVGPGKLRIVVPAPTQAVEVVPRERNETAQRIFNVVVATVALALSLPLCLIIALLIRVTSRGPVLYAQTRVGRDRRHARTYSGDERRVQDLGGQVFTIYKFRTMRVDAERISGAVWAHENDPRVTKVGRYLRMLRLDEIPQLWNVIRGDMNIVGPRPERPSIVARLRETIPRYQYRHRVKPGITGLAQINQRYDTCLEDVRSKVEWDIRYIENQSLWLDIQIMLRTIPAILLKYRGW
jgi:lipopolysaccharide/colanic/teichoic acid biosynthesis glycosyltransferase